MVWSLVPPSNIQPFSKPKFLYRPKMNEALKTSIKIPQAQVSRKSQAQSEDPNAFKKQAWNFAHHFLR